jgi:hypothetical protein
MDQLDLISLMGGEERGARETKSTFSWTKPRKGERFFRRC